MSELLSIKITRPSLIIVHVSRALHCHSSQMVVIFVVTFNRCVLSYILNLAIKSFQLVFLAGWVAFLPDAAAGLLGKIAKSASCTEQRARAMRF